MPERRRAWLPLACAVACLALAAPAGAATTRAEYATQVNTVCAAAEGEARRIVDKYFVAKVVANPEKEKPRKINVKKALRNYSNLFSAFQDLNQRTIEGIAAVTPAPGDEALVASWVQRLRAAHELSRPVVRRTMEALRFLLRANPTTGDDELFTKAEKRKLKRLQRRISRAANVARRESVKASEIAIQLGATECAIESSSAAAAARAALRAG